MAGFDATQIEALSNDSMAGFSRSQLKSLSAEARSALNSDPSRFSMLTAEQKAALAQD